MSAETAPSAPKNTNAMGLSVFDKFINNNPPVATVKVEANNIPDNMAPK